MDSLRAYDLLVVGGGNAGLCAALTARARGLDVLVVESAPIHLRGGNSRHTRNMRTMHAQPLDVLSDAYPEEEYWQDLVKVTGGRTDETLARATIRDTAQHPSWMRQHGVRFQPPLAGTLQLGRTNLFFLGGGKALINAYYGAAQSLGIDVAYDTEAIDFDIRDGRFFSATATQQSTRREIRAKALVAASGGFEANFEWLREAWGPPADNFIVRGTPYNIGTVLKRLLEKGARSIGDPTQGHCVAIDARSPKYDGGIVTRVDAVSFGIVVNRSGSRFYDEGEDFWPKRYAIWGRLIAAQPDQIAFALIDAKAMGRFVPPLYPPIESDSIAGLAKKLGLDPPALVKTVVDFNAAVRSGTFDHRILDNCATENLEPPKSHWARGLDTPPYYAYPLRPGITFTYLGVAVDDKARMILQDGKAAPNIFAAGEIMAGNVLGNGYLAGIGMAIGTTFGRIAGDAAARHVLG